MHEFEPQRSINAAFIAAPGFNFVIQGAEATTGLARISIGVKMKMSKNFADTAGFDTDLYKTPSYDGCGGLSVSW